MKIRPEATERRLAELRLAFDESFASPPPEPARDLLHFLAIRVAGDPYALRLTELAGLQPYRKIVSLPGSAAGLAGVRGRLVAVYSLAVLLGYPTVEAKARWIVVCEADHSIGLVIEDFERHQHVAGSALQTAAESGPLNEHVSAIYRDEPGSRSVLAIPSILAAIRRQTGGGRA